MLPVSLLSALAASPDLGKLCTADDRVALSPTLHRRVAADCPSVVPAERVSDFLLAFALYPRELAEPDNAARLARTVDARWVVLDKGKSLLVFDAREEGFVDAAIFSPGPSEPATPPDPAEAAYREGYRALRAKRYDAARTHLERCISLEPTRAACHWELGWVHWVADDWAAAATSWEAVQQHRPDHPEVGEWLPKARAKAKSDPE